VTTRGSLSAAAVLGAVAIVIVGAVILLASARREGDQDAAARPSASPSASASLPRSSAPASPSTTPSAATSGVRPDAAHGLITFTNIRSEADPKDLQQPPQFTRSPGAVPFTEGVGLSADGREVALVRTGQTGQQLIAFTTSRPNDVSIVIDFAGGGESAAGLVWAGDGVRSVVIAVHKLTSTSPQSPTAYSSLRVVDLATKQVREIARITSGSYFFPIAWRSDRRVAAALEVAAGAAQSYDLLRDGASPERTTLGGSYGPVTASRDGLRIAAVSRPGPDVGDPSVRWWPMEQPSAAKTIAAEKGRPELAAFRPGSPDEIGLSVTAPCVGCPGVPPQHFEIWNIATGQQRVVSPSVGFQFWRVDGTAAIDGNLLIDPSTGATTQLPGGAFKIVDVVMF
jgi:hypothetical protein